MGIRNPAARKRRRTDAPVPGKGSDMILTIDNLRVVSEANQREHWAAKNRRKKAQQQRVAVELCAVRDALPKPPLRVRLTRIGPRVLDTDNLAGSFKHVQDGIARHFGVDDGDGSIRWEYDQSAIGKHQYAVVVEMTEMRA